MKNIVAATAVLRLRKFAEPLEPNKLPAEPEPNAAPISAPLPCWINTKPIKTAAVTTCTTQTRFSTHYSETNQSKLLLTCATDRQKLFGDQGRTTDQPTIDIRHGEQLRCIRGLYATAVQYNQTLGNLRIMPCHPLTNESMHCLRLL